MLRAGLIFLKTTVVNEVLIGIGVSYMVSFLDYAGKGLIFFLN